MIKLNNRRKNKMEEIEVKEILKDTIETDEVNRIYEGDFLTRDTYFCLEMKDKSKFMIIVKAI